MAHVLPQETAVHVHVYLPNVPSPVTTVTYFFLFLCALESNTFFVTFLTMKIRMIKNY